MPFADDMSTSPNFLTCTDPLFCLDGIRGASGGGESSLEGGSGDTLLDPRRGGIGGGLDATGGGAERGGEVTPAVLRNPALLAKAAARAATDVMAAGSSGSGSGSCDEERAGKLGGAAGLLGGGARNLEAADATWAAFSRTALTVTVGGPELPACARSSGRDWKYSSSSAKKASFSSCES